MTSLAVEMAPLGQVALAKHFADGYRPDDPNAPARPAYVFRREHASHVWLVASTPLTGPEPIRWCEVHDGPFVMVPLVPYIALPEAELVFGFAWQLAALALASLPCDPLVLQLALGRPAEDLFPSTGERRIRVHAGLAVRVK